MDSSVNGSRKVNNIKNNRTGKHYFCISIYDSTKNLIKLTFNCYVGQRFPI